MPRHQNTQTTLPPLDGLPPNVIADLEKLKSLAENDLRTILLETVPVHTQKKISRLLQQQQAVTLSEKERAKLSVLQKQADLVMLRKAYAAALLHFRGYRLPTVAELHHQT